MKRAVIFDFDGVLINSESAWDPIKDALINDLAGFPVSRHVGLTRGISAEGIHALAVQHGATFTFRDLMKGFDERAPRVYGTAPIAGGAFDCFRSLSDQGMDIAIVSASPMGWINIGLERLGIRQYLRLVISLHDRPDLAHKPDPAGYLEAMKRLSVEASNTVIVEDSNPGIQAGRAAGAYVVATREMLVKGQSQSGADVYIDKLVELPALLSL